ncbi:hypothetical protein QFZ47_003142 [Variovorax paradoxus]|nr:hypothetical protein [Variovorax paradoxus]
MVCEFVYDEAAKSHLVALCLQPGDSVSRLEREKRGRKPLAPALPREIVRHELPEAERVCAHDGHALVEIGAEISEQMDDSPEQVRVLQRHPIKYACPSCRYLVALFKKLPLAQTVDDYEALCLKHQARRRVSRPVRIGSGSTRKGVID